MQNPLAIKSWSPYAVGAGIGVLSWFAFLTAKHALGITTAFETTAGMAEQLLAPDLIKDNSFFAKPLKIDWGWMVVLGVFLGAFFSSIVSGDRSSPTVPPLWADRFGKSQAVRFIGAFVGGAMMMLGARLAGGCTSGHGISGSLQLAASGWLFVIVAFSTGIATAFILYGVKGRAHV